MNVDSVSNDGVQISDSVRKIMDDIRADWLSQIEWRIELENNLEPSDEELELGEQLTSSLANAVGLSDTVEQLRKLQMERRKKITEHLKNRPVDTSGSDPSQKRNQSSRNNG